jgi:TetR/AcrR family transcriptional regulator
MAATNGRDPKRTREKIIHNAILEFSTKGYDGARVDKIALRSRLSKNMLYYYFGSKEKLYIAVLEEVYTTLRERQADLIVRAQKPLDALNSLIDHTFHAFVEAPEVIRLLNEENMYKGRYIRKSKRLRELYDPLEGTLKEVIDRGSAEGAFRADIDPRVLYLSLSSLIYHVISNQYTLELALGIDLGSPGARTAWLAHVKELIQAFVRLPDPRPPTASTGKVAKAPSSPRSAEQA